MSKVNALEFDQDVKDLLNILSLRRPHESKGEHLLIKEFIKPTGAYRDGYGNYILKIGEAPILWSCHTDTVHTHRKDKVRQKLLLDKENGMIYVEGDDCLGADNGVGVWICLEMIKAGVEGLYIFHRKEETGGHGSRYISTHTPSLLKDIKIAIAFDRRGTNSIITHQISRCCSDEFANDLAEALDFGHSKDDGGTFTDTANYTELIPECTNISAGFFSEHTWQEALDLTYAKALKNKMLEIDLSNVRIVRDPQDPLEYPDYYYGGYYGSGLYGSGSEYPDYEDIYREYILGNPELVYKVIASWGMVSDVVSDMAKMEMKHDNKKYAY